MAFTPYLFFSGTCREAFTRYQEVFGGQLDVMTSADAPAGEEMPGASPETVMNAALVMGDGGLLMGSDDPTGDGGPFKGVAVNFSTRDVGEAERVFAALADGGEVTMPISEVFWSPRFGMCTDRFGTPWMVNVEPDAAPSPA